ncbi:hypothetical protein FCM35_KLT15716 [Carex littledalei]|uniref:Uncharacterized protein n=1 Tax=Carex littledalei TaxID=544730 RepID=A0A833VSB1_9POAL|nr:hypothetical protein FCM35_KLT15716 [Carex littledalei]
MTESIIQSTFVHTCTLSHLYTADNTKNLNKRIFWRPTQNNPPPQPPPKSLPELLKEHDLPLGLFPKNITGYNFDVNTRKITVDVPGICDVSGLRFSNTVTGCLERGRLNHIKGIRTESLTWEEVHCIEIKLRKGKLHLHLTGKVDKLRRLDEFATLKDVQTKSFTFGIL